MTTIHTFSGYAGAYALYRGARRLGLPCVTHAADPDFPIPRATGPSQPEDWLMLTDEAALARALAGDSPGRFLPRHFPLPLLDDKWAFAAWLQTQPDLAQSPPQWPLEALDDVPWPSLLKARHSWLDGQKIERGWICRNRCEAEDRLRALRHVQPRWLAQAFFQAWLGDDDCRVISACGFFDAADPTRHLEAVVERVAAHHAGVSCSAAVCTREDEWGVLDKAHAILARLDYTGPYEMEFLIAGDEVYFLELNPRFWLQHVIFLRHGNGLMRRYLGLDNAADRQQTRLEKTLWIDGVHLVASTLRLRLGLLALMLDRARWRGYTRVLWPSLPVAVWVCARLYLRKQRRARADRARQRAAQRAGS